MSINDKVEMAIDICNGKRIDGYQEFFKIYPFSTENLAGWMPLFDFIDKSFLTVGSSCDQVFNASLLGSKEQTVIDINPFVKEYFFLKKAGLSVLSREEYLNFFCSYNYNRAKNENVFNLKSFERIIPTIAEYNQDANMFWSKMFENFNGLDIKQNLFLSDEERCSPILQKMNPYLNNDKSYCKTQEAIKILNVDFIGSDVYQNNEWGLYNNINISNIGQYARSQEDLMKFRSLVLYLADHLTIDGMMMFMYIFGTIKNDFNNDIKKSIIELFTDTNNEVYTFPSVKEFVLGDTSSPDSAMVYRKTR